jgi:mono/diheme cytochrome c family protein
MRTVLVALAAAVLAVSAAADEKPVQLKKAAGLDKVETGCASCHSLDYVEMN